MHTAVYSVEQGIELTTMHYAPDTGTFESSGLIGREVMNDLNGMLTGNNEDFARARDELADIHGTQIDHRNASGVVTPLDFEYSVLNEQSAGSDSDLVVLMPGGYDIDYLKKWYLARHYRHGFARSMAEISDRKSVWQRPLIGLAE